MRGAPCPLPEQWERIERAAQGTGLTANQFVMELVIEALDRRDWPKTEAEVSVARASLFPAQVLARPHRGRTRERGSGNPRIHLDNRAGYGHKAGYEASNGRLHRP